MTSRVVFDQERYSWCYSVLCLPCLHQPRSKASITLKMKIWNYQLTNQNRPVCDLGTVLLFNWFWVQNLSSDLKSYRTFSDLLRKTGPWLGTRRGYETGVRDYEIGALDEFPLTPKSAVIVACDMWFLAIQLKGQLSWWWREEGRSVEWNEGIYGVESLPFSFIFCS